MHNMSFMLSVIESSSPERFASLWTKMIAANKEKFHMATLYKVFENFFSNYQFISVIAWQTKNEYIENIIQLADLEGLASVTNHIYEGPYKIQYSTRKNLPKDENNIFLLNLFAIQNEQMDDCLALWEEDNEFMQSQKGAVGTNFFKSITNNNQYKFINIAEWKSKQDWLTAFQSERFGQFLKLHKEKNHKFYPALAHRIVVIPSSETMKKPHEKT